MAVIDHLVYAVPRLDDAIDWIEKTTGIRPAVGGSHVGRGTHNALVSLGSSYLELIAPDPAQSDPPQPRPFGVDQIEHAALVAFAVRPDEGDTIDAVVERSIAAGYDAGPIVAMSRATAEGNTLSWRLTFPRPEFGGLVPFVIDWGETPRPHETSPSGLGLESFVATHPDPNVINSLLTAIGVTQLRLDPAPGSTMRAHVVGPSGSVTLASA